MRDGPGITESEVLEVVHRLRDRGELEITPEMILAEHDPGYLAASEQADVDLVYPSVTNLLIKAGRDGLLPVQEEHRGSTVFAKVVFHK